MPTRRTFIKQASVVCAMTLIAPHLRAVASGRFYMPDEGEKHRQAFIAFGAQDAIWEDFTADVQAALGRIARAIADYEPVTVFCREDERHLAEKHCGTRNITFVETALDDIWMRDTGANFVIDGSGGLGAVDFNFNGWGNKQQHDEDALLAAQIAEETGARPIRSGRVGEGGGIEVDGLGTGIMTESS